MNEYTFILPIALALMIGAMSPGPSFLVVTQTALAKSRLNGIAVAVGTGLGAATFALLAGLGLYVVLETVPWIYTLLKIVGGLYLCFLAYKLWITAQQPVELNTETQPQTTGLVKSFALGLITQLSNPKTAIVFGGVFAAFLPAEVPAYGYLILCVLAFVIDFGWYATVAVVLSTPKAQTGYARFKKYINRAASGVMGLMGLKLVTDY